MNIAVMAQPGSFGSRSITSGTPTHSKLWGFRLPSYSEQRLVSGWLDPEDISARLARAYTEITRAISERYRYFGADLSVRLMRSFSALLDPEEFDGSVPSISEIITLLRAIQLVNRPDVSVGLTELGVVSATWSDPRVTLYIEVVGPNQVRAVKVVEEEKHIQTIELEAATLQKIGLSLGL